MSFMRVVFITVSLVRRRVNGLLIIGVIQTLLVIIDHRVYLLLYINIRVPSPIRQAVSPSPSPRVTAGGCWAVEQSESVVHENTRIIYGTSSTPMMLS